MKNISLPIALAIAITGCGGSGSNSSGNASPSFSVPAEVNLLEDSSLTVELKTNRPASDLRFSFKAEPAAELGASINANELLLIPASNYFGQHEIVIEATDGNQTFEHQITVNVTAVNDAPIYTGDKQVSLQQHYSNHITLGATDIEGDAIEYSVGALPDGMIAQFVSGEAGSLLSFQSTGYAGTANVELYISDGDQRTTENIQVEVSSSLLFTANDGYSGREVWFTDGESTRQAEDIHSGIAWSNPGQFTTRGSQTYFTASDGTVGNELWVAYGTSVSLVSDITQGSGGSFPKNLVESESYLYFTTQVPGYRQAVLYRTQGTDSTTKPLTAMPSGNPQRLTTLGDDVLFLDQLYDSGYEWFKYSSVTGITKVKEINNGGVGAGITTAPDTVQIFKFEDHVFFAANDGNHLGTWVTDGTNQGTYKVGSATENFSLGTPFTKVGNFLYYAHQNSGHYYIMRIDLTKPTFQSEQVYALSSAVDGSYVSAITGMHNINNKLVVSSHHMPILVPPPHGINIAMETIDTTESAHHRVLSFAYDDANEFKLIDNSQLPGAFDQNITVSYALNNRLLLLNRNIKGNTVLWSSTWDDQNKLTLPEVIADPQADNTIDIKMDIDQPGRTFNNLVGSSNERQLVFAAFSAASGWEPWVTDGSVEGTRLLSDIAAGDRSGLDYFVPAD